MNAFRRVALRVLAFGRAPEEIREQGRDVDIALRSLEDQDRRAREQLDLAADRTITQFGKKVAPSS